MKKFYFYLTFLTLAILMPLQMFGQIPGVSVSDGNDKVFFSFDEKPEVTFSDTNIIISTSDKEISFPITSSVSFEFVDAAGINDSMAPEIGFSFTSNEIKITGLNPGETVCIYSLDGRNLLTAPADASGEWAIASDTLPKQPLIIKTTQKAYKIIIR